MPQRLAILAVLLRDISMATATTLSLALLLGIVFVLMLVKTILLVRLLSDRIKKLRAVRAQWSEIGVDDWEISQSDVKVAEDVEGRDIVLGRGTFGLVVQGLKGGVQPVAIKTMARTKDATSEEAFIREIAMLKYLSRDRNIVQFYGACVQSSSMLLVAELMEGGDLRSALNTNTTGRFSWWQQGKSIAIDVARGLAFLHSCGVIHRDIKSSNVLLTESGLAKIADVGLAKLAGGEGQANRDQAFGTLSWAAPEVLLGDRATEKVDIYALGVMLWEICTGDTPKRGNIRELSPQEGPPEVVELIAACMQREPLCRPSARDVCRVLYKAAPVWEEPPDVRDLLDTPSHDITEDTDLLPPVAGSTASVKTSSGGHADRLRTDRLAAEKPQLQGLIRGIRARLDATRSATSSSGAKVTPTTTSSGGGGTPDSPASGGTAQVRSWLSTVFGRRGSARVVDLSTGSQEDGSVASRDGDALPTVRQAKIAQQSAWPTAATTGAGAVSTVPEAAPEAIEHNGAAEV